LERLKLISFDPASLKEAQELIPVVQTEIDKAAEAAKKTAEEKAAAEKAAQRRTWFYTLDKYYSEFKELDDEAGLTARIFLGPVVAKMNTMQKNIVAYCNSHTGMQPTELDAMRQSLSNYVSNKYKAMYYFALEDESAFLGYLILTEVFEQDYLKQREIVAKRYGF